MKTFTTRPGTEWTVSNTTYQVGTSITGIYNLRTQGSTTAVASSSNTGGSTAGLTASNQTGGTTSIRHITESARTRSTVLTESSRTALNVHQSSHNPNSAINFSDTYSETEARHIVRSFTAGDSSSAAISNTSLTSSSSSTASDTHSSTTTASTTALYTTTSTSVAHTTSGSSTTHTTETVPQPSTATYTATTGSLSVITTTSSSASFSTTVTSTTGSVSSSSSTWGTAHSTLTGRSTTETTDTGSLTWTADETTNLTATTHPRTSWAFETLLRDTVFLLNGDPGTDYNLGGMLWAFRTDIITAGQSTAGLFSALYSSTAAETVTLPERSAFLTSSAAVTAITTSTATATTTSTRTSTTDTAQPPETYTATSTATSYNGSSYEATAFTVTHSATWNLGDVSTSESTGTITTTTDTAAPAATTSSTIFTHSIQSTGYSAGTLWTSTTTTVTWGDVTSASGTHTAPWSSTSTTLAKSSRFSTTDAALVSSFSTWSTGTATSDTISSFLGLVSTATTRVYSSTSTFSAPTWHAALHASVPSQTSSFIIGGDSRLETTSGAASLTAWTEARASIRASARPEHDNMPDHNQAWYQVHPRGFAGFGGSFTISTLPAYLTTTQGLAAGSTFTAETLQITRTAQACEGLTFFPVTTGFELGGTANALSTSLISTPSVMTSQISVAVTWSSTTSTTASAGTTSASTTRAATHTLGVTSSITGEFWSADAITFNSAARSEMPGGAISGGYAIGDNNRGTAWRVFLRQGAATWTEYTAGQSTAALTHSSTGTDASISFSVPYSHAAVISMEPVLTARWDTAGNASAFSSQQHLKHQ